MGEQVQDGRTRMTGFGITVYIGRGWVFHLSTEDGLQVERAAHRTLRFGFVAAVRSIAPSTDEGAPLSDQQATPGEPGSRVSE